LKTGCVDEVQRAGCAAHCLASCTLISEDLFALDVVAFLAAEGQQVSIVGELPAIDAFVEAVVDHDHQRLTACLAGGQIVPVRRDVDVLPWTLGYERIGKRTARVRVVRIAGRAGSPLKGLGTLDGFVSLDAIGKTFDALDGGGTKGELE
jgi:hypothetical protein